MRLINADELKKHCTYLENCLSQGQAVWVEDIDAMPTIDAVEVVRCEHCRYHSNGNCSLNGWSPKDDDFCPYGDRGDDNGKIN